MLPGKHQVICSLNTACLSSEPPRSCWLSNKRTSLALNSKALPTSAAGLRFLNTFLPHPLTYPSSTITLFPPATLLHQFNTPTVKCPAAADEGQCHNFYHLHSSYNLVQLPSNQMRNNLLLSPVPGSACPSFACVVTTSSQLGSIAGFGLISLPFCSCQAGEQTMPGDSSGSAFLLQKFAVLPTQRLGWESRMSHNAAIFPAKKRKKSQHPKRSSRCGSCFIIKNTATA